MSEYENVYQLRAETADRLARDPAGLLAELIAADPRDGEGQFLMLRFIEGRERNEKDLPTDEEFTVVAKHYAEVETFWNMFNLVKKGFLTIDVVEEDGELTTAFGLTSRGREAVEAGSDLGLP